MMWGSLDGEVNNVTAIKRSYSEPVTLGELFWLSAEGAAGMVDQNLQVFFSPTDRWIIATLLTGNFPRSTDKHISSFLY